MISDSEFKGYKKLAALIVDKQIEEWDDTVNSLYFNQKEVKKRVIARIKNLKNTRGVTYLDIAKACKVSRSRVLKWFNGDAMPDATSIDIMYAKFFPGLYDADYLEGLFSHAYEEKHNVDGQIGICEANKEEHHDKVNKEGNKYEIDDEIDDCMRRLRHRLLQLDRLSGFFVGDRMILYSEACGFPDGSVILTEREKKHKEILKWAVTEVKKYFGYIYSEKELKRNVDCQDKRS